MGPFGVVNASCAQLCGAGLLYRNRLDMGQMVPVLCHFIEWIKNVPILLPFQLRVLYKYYSAGIMHMNKVRRFNLEALSECDSACH